MKRNLPSRELDRRDWIDEFFGCVFLTVLCGFVAFVLVALDPLVGPR